MAVGVTLGLGALGGAALGFLGQKDANKKNIALAREQMAFQERMRNTQFQAAATDLEKAGLNRILALGSPAASPAGALAKVGNPAAALASTALEWKRTDAQAKLMKEQANAASEQAKLLIEQKWNQVAQASANANMARYNWARANIELEREKIVSRKPWLLEAQMMSNPAGVAVSGAGQLLRGLKNAKWGQTWLNRLPK